MIVNRFGRCGVRIWASGDMEDCDATLPCAAHGTKEKASMSTKDTNPKDAIGSTKPPLSTLPCGVMFELGAAMLEGACKYRRHNYRVAGVRASIYYDAAMRHLMRWWEGEELDPDSGVSHITKALACLVILRDCQMNDMVNDDRPPPPKEWYPNIEKSVKGVLDRFPNPLPPYTASDKE